MQGPSRGDGPQHAVFRQFAQGVQVFVRNGLIVPKQGAVQVADEDGLIISFIHNSVVRTGFSFYAQKENKRMNGG
jgi:hypothetical protein